MKDVLYLALPGRDNQASIADSQKKENLGDSFLSPRINIILSPLSDYALISLNSLENNS